MSLFVSHPSFATLVDFAEARLSPEQTTSVSTHLAGCARCRGQVEWLTHTISLMRTDPSEDAPPAVIDKAVRLFRARPVPVTPTLRQRLSAALRFDSGGLSLAYGVRAGQPAPRQLLFEAPGYDIDLRLTPEDTGWVIMGQVLGETSIGQVELQGTNAMFQTTLNEQGFALPGVPAGQYSLTVRLSSLDLVVPELILDAPD